MVMVVVIGSRVLTTYPTILRQEFCQFIWPFIPDHGTDDPDSRSLPPLLRLAGSSRLQLGGSTCRYVVRLARCE